MSSYTPGLSSSCVSTASLMGSLPDYPLYPNIIRDFTSSIFQSEAARANGVLSHDVSAVLNGHCYYHQNMVCDQFDFQIIDQLFEELTSHEATQKKLHKTPTISTGEKITEDPNIAEQGGYHGIVHWNNHFKYEDPSFSPTFHLLTQILGEYFDLNVLATRLNIYTPTDWKTFHHDSHKYSKGQKEDFTVGVSFGATRSLSFLHPPTGATFEFPQGNGDVFAFDSVVNGVFMHGVPQRKAAVASSVSGQDDTNGPRISIICWGKRRTLNERNCGKEYALEMKKQEQEDHFGPEDEKDEQMFQANNKKYAYYEPPITTEKLGNKSSTSSSSAPSNSSSLPLTATKDQITNPPPPVAGIPLSEVITMMKTWQEGQKISKQASSGNLKRIFALQSKVKPLLQYWIDFYTQYLSDNDPVLVKNNITMKSIQSKFDTSAMNLFLSLNLQNKHLENNTPLDNQQYNNEHVIQLRSDPILTPASFVGTNNTMISRPKQKVMFGPQGLMIRVGATNKRFELIPSNPQQSQSQSQRLQKQQQKQQQQPSSSNPSSVPTSSTSSSSDHQSKHSNSNGEHTPESQSNSKKKAQKQKKKIPDDFF